VLTASIIALMIETASTYETSVNFYETIRRNNPEDSRLQHITYIIKFVPSGVYGLFMVGGKENILK
jgi:hypothetical protein